MASYARLSDLVSAVAAAAGENSEVAPQTDFTVIGALEKGKREVPRVAWVPRGGPIDPAEDDEDTMSKSAYVRRLRCEVTFTNTSYETAETLMHDFLGGLARTQPKAAVTGEERHAEETLTGTNRYQITIEVVVLIPVLFEVYTPATVTSATPTVSIS